MARKRRQGEKCRRLTASDQLRRLVLHAEPGGQTVLAFVPGIGTMLGEQVSVGGCDETFEARLKLVLAMEEDVGHTVDLLSLIVYQVEESEDVDDVGLVRGHDVEALERGGINRRREDLPELLERLHEGTLPESIWVCRHALLPSSVATPIRPPRPKNIAQLRDRRYATPHPAGGVLEGFGFPGDAESPVTPASFRACHGGLYLELIPPP